jgi:hypothetical protein
MDARSCRQGVRCISARQRRGSCARGGISFFFFTWTDETGRERTGFDAGPAGHADTGAIGRPTRRTAIRLQELDQREVPNLFTVEGVSYLI